MNNIRFMSKLLTVLIITVGVIPFLSPMEIGDNYLFTPAFVLKSVWGVVASVLLLSLWLFQSYKERVIIVKNSNIYTPVIGFITWCLITLFWVIDDFRATIFIIQFVSYALILFLTVNIASNSKQVEILINTIIISLIGVSTIGLSQYYFLDIDFIQKIFFQATAPSATFGNKNMASHFMAMTLPLAMVMLLLAKDRFKLIFYSVAVIIGSWFLIYTVARQAYLAVAVELFILFLFFILDYWKNKNKSLLNQTNLKIDKGMATIVILLFLTFAANFTNQGWKSDNDAGLKISTIQNITKIKNNPRLPAWRNTIEMIKDYPITGVGVGQWHVNYPVYRDRVMKDMVSNDHTKLLDLHNDYLQIIANVGLIGLVFLLWLLFILINRVWVILSDSSYQNREQVLAVTLGMLGFLVVAMFSFPISVYLPAFLVMIYIGIVFSIDIRPTSTVRIKLKKSAGYSMMIFSSLLVVGLLYLSYIWIYGEHYHYKSADFSRDKQLDLAKNFSIKSIELNKFNPAYQKMYAHHLTKLKQYNEAIRVLKSISDKSLFDAKYWLELSNLYRKTNQINEEKIVLERIIDFDPLNFRALSRLAYVYSKLKDNQKASDFYKRMRNSFVYFKDRSGFGPYHKSAIKTSIMVKDYQFSNFVCKDLLIKNPLPEHYVLCGVLEYKYLDKSAAMQLLVKAIELDVDVEIPEEIRKDLKI